MSSGHVHARLDDSLLLDARTLSCLNEGSTIAGVNSNEPQM